MPIPTPQRGDVHDRILDHYRRFWGASRVDEVHWTPGHVGERLPDLHIAKVRPAQPGEMWCFATIGAWQATEEASHGLEFVGAARSEAVSVLWHLALTAYYHAGPPDYRLDVGQTVSIGEGWVEGSTLDAILVSLPYPWGPDLEHCLLPERHIRVLWLLPISEAERRFAGTDGVEALERRFDDAAIDYLDPFRPSVV